MFYCVMEFKEGIGEPLRDQQGAILRFDNEKEANIERIYQQPDYDNLLKVIGVKQRSCEGCGHFIRACQCFQVNKG